MRKYAFAHPGKIGDMLYILPSVHTICERDEAVADIYTSEACRAAEDLVKYIEDRNKLRGELEEFVGKGIIIENHLG